VQVAPEVRKPLKSLADYRYPLKPLVNGVAPSASESTSADNLAIVPSIQKPSQKRGRASSTTPKGKRAKALAAAAELRLSEDSEVDDDSTQDAGSSDASGSHGGESVGAEHPPQMSAEALKAKRAAKNYGKTPKSSERVMRKRTLADRAKTRHLLFMDHQEAGLDHLIAVSEEQATHAENSNLILHGLAKDNQAKLRLEAFKIAKETGTDYEAVLEMVGISKESTVPVLKPVAPRPARPDLKSAFNDAFDAASSDGHDPDD